MFWLCSRDSSASLAWSVLLGDRDRERLRSGHRVLGGELPFAERGVRQGVEAAAAAIAFEDAKDRRRKRGERFAFDDRAGFGAEQLDVEGVAAAAAVEHTDDLVDAARLRRARLALLDLAHAAAVGDEQRQRAVDVRRDVDRDRAD